MIRLEKYVPRDRKMEIALAWIAVGIVGVLLGVGLAGMV